MEAPDMVIHTETDQSASLTVKSDCAYATVTTAKCKNLHNSGLMATKITNFVSDMEMWNHKFFSPKMRTLP